MKPGVEMRIIGASCITRNDLVSEIQTGSLVLYKIRPALVDAVGAKYQISFADGKSKKVRDKDITLLHPGPLESLAELTPQQGNVEEAWELLQGEEADLAELAELVYEDYTPATAWAAWELLRDDVYFEGNVHKLRSRNAQAVQEIRQERDRKAAAKAEWDAFLQRLEQGRLEPTDRSRLSEVERLALGQLAHSRILAALNVAETAEAAHAFLIKVGYWPQEYNPWPRRQGAILETPQIPLPELPDEQRLDLTHLSAWAIDDEGNTDPDDAISLDGDRIWVHVADVAALVHPDSHADKHARRCGANLYLPETVVTMLPAEATQKLGLGLSDESPALSFGFVLNKNAEVTDIEITPSRVKVTRMSYDAVDQRMDEAPFAALYELTQCYRSARLARNAAQINLPEVSVKVSGNEIRIKPLPRLASCDMVTDAMLMAGEAAARFAQAHEIPIPYAVQPEPQEIRQPAGMAEAFAYRRLFKPSAAALTPGRHFGLGLDSYARATSPLRRYVDLVVHQQLRRFVTGKAPMDQAEVSERVAAAGAVTGVIRRAERLSNQHWKLIYLKRNRDWQGEAVILGLEDRKAVVMIPELALESRIRRSDDMVLDQTLKLKLQDVDITTQTAYFRRV